jgi:imidazolonepropionase-like amidohydrolase
MRNIMTTTRMHHAAGLLLYAVSLVSVLISPTVYGSDQIPGKPQDHPIAIVGATIHPVSSPAIEKGTILFDKGRIVSLGAGIPIPQGTEVIDGAGKHVYPGLFSSNTTVGLVEIGAVRASRDMTEVGRINPNVRAEAAFNPDSELIPVLRANGITMAVSTPNGGVISGTSAVMMMDGWTWEDMTLKAPAALCVNWPDMSISKSPRWGKSEADQRKERELAIEELTGAFRDARAYMGAKQAESAQGIPYHDTDSRWEAMIPVLQGKVPVVVFADDILEIEAAVAWADREHLKLVIGSGHDAWRVADLPKKHDVAVLAGGIYRLPDRSFEEYDEPFLLPAKLFKAGVRFSIITADEPGHERNLPYHAATAAAYGLPKEEALRAITLSPAEIFGVADRVGSLDPGKDATLIVTTGDPLEIESNVTMEFIQGRKVDLSSKQTALFEKYKEKYRRTKK